MSGPELTHERHVGAEADPRGSLLLASHLEIHALTIEDISNAFEITGEALPAAR